MNILFSRGTSCNYLAAVEWSSNHFGTAAPTGAGQFRIGLTRTIQRHWCFLCNSFYSNSVTHQHHGRQDLRYSQNYLKICASADPSNAAHQLHSVFCHILCNVMFLQNQAGSKNRKYRGSLGGHTLLLTNKSMRFLIILLGMGEEVLSPRSSNTKIASQWKLGYVRYAF